jgi:AraC-like DNA-binding protein
MYIEKMIGAFCMASVDPQIRFTSAMYPERERFDGWREEFARKVLNLDVVKFGEQDFQSELAVWTDGVASIGEVSTSACMTRRTRELIGDGRDDIFLFEPTQGALSCGRAGGEFVAGPGGIAFQRTDEIGHLTHHEQDGMNSYRWIHIPAASLSGRVRNLADMRGDLLTRRLAAHASRVQLLRAYAAFVRGNAGAADAGSIHAMMSHLADLAVLALGPAPHEMDRIEMGGLRAARHRKLVAELERRFRDPDMSAGRLGLAVGISERYVQSIFAAAQSTLGEELIRIRLGHAQRMLTEARRDAMSIADIAMACGFSDLSHFNRSFKRRFGETPREMRRQSG